MVENKPNKSNMEIRKIQMTGGSSYVLTLPKEWVKALGIKKNDPIGIVVQPDGTLIVTAKTSSEQVQRRKEFSIDELREPTHLFRLLIGAYIMGHTTIEVKSRERIDPSVRESIIEFTQKAIGPEIIEETSKSITIKDLLSPTEMPFDKTLKRMYILVRSMHEDAVRALKEKDNALASNVIDRDRELDRLHWLVARQSNIIFGDITLARKMNVSTEEAAYYFMISRFVERIGDHAVRIARSAQELMGMKVDAKIVESITVASETSLTLLKNSIDAWFKRDIAAANENVDSVHGLNLLCEEITHAAMRAKGARAVSVSYIAESIRRTGELSGDISEIVINNLVRE